MAYVDNQTSSEEVSDEESQTRGKSTKSTLDEEISDEANGDDDYAPAGKKAKKQKPKKRKADSDEDSDEKEDDDYTPSGKKGKKQKPKKKKDDSDEDSDEFTKKKKPAKKAAAATGGPRKPSAFTKSYRLSPELADVVGAEVMPRQEVVKKLWAVIKERNLQDPKQKQFAICDDQLMKVFGIKRFRTFGMMKYLKGHFVEAA